MKDLICIGSRSLEHILRNVLVDTNSCPLGSAAGRNKLCVFVCVQAVEVNFLLEALSFLGLLG